MKPDDVKIDMVVRYYPITTRADFVLVKIVEAPWQLGSGDWICKAKRADNFEIVRPWTGALAPHQGAGQ